jgi:hypothetical protein
MRPLNELEKIKQGAGGAWCLVDSDLTVLDT